LDRLAWRVAIPFQLQSDLQSDIGRGELPPASGRELLAGRNRRLAAPTAPAGGLWLASVAYDPAFDLPAVEAA